ncbi:MAG: RHS repeat domain-containing protein [Sphingomonas sp.]
MIKPMIGFAGASAALLVAGAAQATETVSYTYDAKGRLVQVVHSGSVNNGVNTQYTHDKADNRTKVKTTGAP